MARKDYIIPLLVNLGIYEGLDNVTLFHKAAKVLLNFITQGISHSNLVLSLLISY